MSVAIQNGACPGTLRQPDNLQLIEILSISVTGATEGRIPDSMCGIKKAGVRLFAIAMWMQLFLHSLRTLFSGPMVQLLVVITALL